jgi:hypothetical protein
MHEPLKGHIEEYLQGNRQMPEVEQHLNHCPSCKAEVTAMRQQTLLLHSLKLGKEPEFDPNFYSRVLNRIESQSKTSIWSIFGDSIFARRLSYASISFAVLLGTYFYSTTEYDQPLAGSTPEMILAGDGQPKPVGTDPQKDRDAVLVNLATYSE